MTCCSALKHYISDVRSLVATETVVMQLLFRVVARAAFLLVNCIKRYHTNVTHHLEQSAGQCDLCSVSVDLPSASENISVPGLVELFPTFSGSWSDFISITWTTLKFMIDLLIQKSRKMHKNMKHSRRSSHCGQDAMGLGSKSRIHLLSNADNNVKM